MPQVRIPSRYPAVMGQKWMACRMCGAYTKWLQLKFDAGITEPTADETLTGATSGHTGVVENVTVVSGSWAANNAAGYVELSSPVGIDAETLQAFTDNETVNGSVGGTNMLTAEGAGNAKYWGILHPKSNMVEKDGGWYCKWHYKMKYGDEESDRATLDLDESDRGQI